MEEYVANSNITVIQDNKNESIETIHPQNKDDEKNFSHYKSPNIKNELVHNDIPFSNSTNLSQKSFLYHQKAANLNSLLNGVELNSIIKRDPWEICVKKTLENFQKREYSNSEMKFRIGGRVIYSASKIVRAKSNFIIQDTQDTQDQLQINELDEDDLYDGDNCDSDDDSSNNLNINDILGSTASIFDEDMTLDMDDEQLKKYLLNRNSELRATLSPHAFYSVDRNGQRFLASPIRKVYKRIVVSDLGDALIKTLNYQLKTINRKSQIDQKGIVSKIIPENILKKAEQDRALVELQINNIYEKILTHFKNNEPLSFIFLIISPDPDGIVRTLLYLLQLVNRKKVELWQKISDDQENNTNDDNIGIDIFVSPIAKNEKLAKQKEIINKNQ